MSSCVFCQRIELCAYNVRGFGAVSFEPLNPVVPGHRLFLPVSHVEDARDRGGLHSAIDLASKWAQDWENNPRHRSDFNLITSAGPAATQTIRHLHVHYVPRREGDGLHLPWTGQARLGTREDGNDDA